MWSDPCAVVGLCVLMWRLCLSLKHSRISFQQELWSELPIEMMFYGKHDERLRSISKSWLTIGNRELKARINCVSFLSNNVQIVIMCVGCVSASLSTKCLCDPVKWQMQLAGWLTTNCSMRLTVSWLRIEGCLLGGGGRGADSELPYRRQALCFTAEK